ncbi:4-hydroxythreonine-4-phosphate dehydrogenase PdxA [Pelagibacterales bacterium SAG-MED39]|nr:4-hydroxythreonine-4-phosphate dehydrogenase PdxA [Pelagibacterales bacterium SAG-MED39]
MSNKPIIIICGEPNSIFSEIIYKSFKKYNHRNPVVLIGSHKLLLAQFKKIGIRLGLNLVNYKNKKFFNLKKKTLNIIDINYKYSKPFEKISSKSNKYLSECFGKAFHILNNSKTKGLINGPISKKYFLKNKYQGVTEYISKKFNIRNYSMLIYNKKLSVSPITTHLPISKVSKKIDKKNIILKVLLISNFYKKYFSKKAKIGITGLNPHCENFFKISEETKVIYPAVKNLKIKKINIKGPFPADTIFLKQNIKKFDVVVGMYHDQVLAPLKALYNFNAINITLGLPFLRISPDHGPNFRMIGKNKSDPESLIDAIKFLDKTR